MKLEVRLGNADREKHGGEEWLEFDPSVYDDMPFGEQAALERQMIGAGGVSLYQLLVGGEIRADTAIGRTSVAWLARQQAGLTEPPFDKFDINHLDMHSRLNRQVAVPLDSGSPTPGGTAPESSGQSPATEPSTRRSRSSRPR